MNAKYSELEVNTEIELSALRDNLHMLKEQAEVRSYLCHYHYYYHYRYHYYHYFQQVSLDATEFKKLKDDNTTKDKEIKILQGILLLLLSLLLLRLLLTFKENSCSYKITSTLSNSTQKILKSLLLVSKMNQMSIKAI